MTSFARWITPHFKADEPSRVDVAIEKDRHAAADERRIHAAIDARDRRQCRACGRHSDPDRLGLTTRGHRHHLVYKSAGGSDEPFNRVTLCYACHNDEHKNRLRIDGDDANKGLTFFRKTADGNEYVTRHELAPHVVEKD